MNRPVVKTIATVLLLIVGILFTLVMRQFGLALSGGGMGTRFFHFLVAGPEGLCLLIWPTLFCLLPWTRIPNIAISVLTLSLLPLAWAAIVLTVEGVQDDAILQIWQSARPVVYIFSALFLLPTLLGLLIATQPIIRLIANSRKPN